MSKVSEKGEQTVNHNNNLGPSPSQFGQFQGVPSIILHHLPPDPSPSSIHPCFTFLRRQAGDPGGSGGHPQWIPIPGSGFSLERDMHGIWAWHALLLSHPINNHTLSLPPHPIDPSLPNNNNVSRGHVIGTDTSTPK